MADGVEKLESILKMLGIDYTDKDCPLCKGEGKKNDIDCPVCKPHKVTAQD